MAFATATATETSLLLSSPNRKTLVNWMKNVRTTPLVFEKAKSIGHVQNVVKDEINYPSPLRPVGAILSPTNIHLNDSGTCLQMTDLNKIHGITKFDLGLHGDVICLEVDPGVTLRQIQLYANGHGYEYPFAAEIGLSTIGGTVFTLTKDSPIGEPALPGMGMGDVASTLFKCIIVNDQGELEDYQFMDRHGSYSTEFQSLLESQGCRGIAVRLWVTLRTKTPVTTTLYLIPFERDDQGCQNFIDRVMDIYEHADKYGGNVFLAIGTTNNVAWLEERIPSNNYYQWAPLSFIMTWLLMAMKGFFQQRVWIPLFLRFFIAISGGPILRFKRSTRPPGYQFAADVPMEQSKVTFDFVSFPLKDFRTTAKEALSFTFDYEKKTGFCPMVFVVYFGHHSGKRLAGPFSGRDHVRSYSFDPAHGYPCDPEWEKYVDAYNVWCQTKQALPSLNQTIGIEKFPEWGATAVSGTCSPRFTTPWLQQFFDANNARMDGNSEV